MKPDFKKWYRDHTGEILKNYLAFLSIPSISTDPAYRTGVHEAATFVENDLKKIGFKVERWETSNHPVIFGSYEAGPSRPTVLIYHHYDVQPVDPLELWKTPPFEPDVREGKVFARGASDNKGQCFYTLTALRAIFEEEKPNLNIKIFVEGEEESGSKGAFEVLKTKQAKLKADYLLIVDSGLPAPETPAITLGLRGIVAMEVRCTNSTVDLHSGIHGGIVLNPNRALIQMLAKLWDEKGKITAPGFYDAVTKPTAQELKEIDQQIDEEYIRRNFGVRVFQGEGGFSLWESNTIRPTLEINGISGGYAGSGFKTVIPSTAVAKISCRLVPKQDPQTIANLLSDYLKKIAPPGLDVQTHWDHGGKPVLSSPHTKIAKICSDAYTEVFGKPCRKILCGASIPLVTDLTEASGGEVAIIGVGLDTDNIHAPNEHFGLDQLEQGFLTMVSIMGRLSQ